MAKRHGTLGAGGYGSLGDAGDTIDWMTGGAGAGDGVSVSDTIKASTEYAKVATRLEQDRQRMNKLGLSLLVMFGVGVGIVALMSRK